MDEKKILMQKLQEIGFAITDVTLYLDSHPTCKHALEYYAKCVKMYKELKEEYVCKFGMLGLTDNTCETCWQWCKEPWPWECEV